MVVHPAPVGIPYEYTVSKKFYESQHLGAAVSMRKFPGAFGAHWFQLSPRERCASLR